MEERGLVRVGAFEIYKFPVAHKRRGWLFPFSQSKAEQASSEIIRQQVETKGRTSLEYLIHL